MDITIDTSAVLSVLLNESHRASILSATAGARLIAPKTLPWELGNALSAMFKQRRIKPEQAAETIELFDRMDIELRDVPLRDAVAMAADMGIYAYDAYMIRCALDAGCPLLTLDRGLRSASHRAGVSVLEMSP